MDGVAQIIKKVVFESRASDIYLIVEVFLSENA